MRSPGKVVTRFAPSPTGYLHIGGARTALFNWAFARRHGGTFILRIEDTDLARSTDDATRKIIADLQWLGLTWNEGPNPDASNPKADQIGDHGPYFQSQRGDIYREYLEKLRAAGRVYEDAAGGGAIRFKMPDHDITVHDLVLGDVTIKREQLEDFIIFKGTTAGGGPTFHFANVVDDATMGVTHVLRAQEHLMNTPKHLALFEAFGLQPPAYAHMPLIFNPDGTKMSKRDKAKAARQAAQLWLKNHANDRAALYALVVAEAQAQGWPPVGWDAEALNQFLDKKSDSNDIAVPLALALRVPLPEIDVHDFRVSGYLQDVLLNYIALLGWSPEGKDQAGGERFDKEYVARHFAVENIGKTNARFDRAKLLAFNAERLQKMPAAEFTALLQQRRPQTNDPLQHLLHDPVRCPWLVAAIQPRIKTLSDLDRSCTFLVARDEAVADPRAMDPKAVQKVLKHNDNAGLKTLRELLPVLEGIAEADWTPPTIHRVIEQFAQASGKPMGDIAQPVRVAVSGGTVSPPLDLTLALLGRASTLNRIRLCLQHGAA